MKFAFLVHSRDYSDIQRKYRIAKYLPKNLIEYWCLNWPPILVSKVTGLKDQKSGEGIEGFIIGIPMTAKQMMENKDLAVQRVVQAIQKAEKYGAELVGLGALTSSVSWGGKLVEDKTRIKITAGHAYTSYIVSSYVLDAIEKFSLNKKVMRLAVVGAAGSIGSTCAEYLACKKIRNFILVDLERKNNLLENLVGRIRSLNADANITSTHFISSIKEADIIIAATNAPEAVIKPEDLKPGAIIVDDAQPSDISPEVMRQRDDVLIMDGGVVKTKDVRMNFNMGLAGKNDVFSCLGEALIFSGTGQILNYKVGEIDHEIIEKLGLLGEEFGFGIGEYQREGKIHEQAKLERISLIIKNQKSS